jgi:hypothetical protein
MNFSLNEEGLGGSCDLFFVQLSPISLAKLPWGKKELSQVSCGKEKLRPRIPLMTWPHFHKENI